MTWIDKLQDVKCEGKSYAQYNEDCIAEEIFKHIGADTKYFVDIGAANASNTRRMLECGWKGIAIDKKPTAEHIHEADVTPVNVNGVLSRLGAPLLFDFLSIDIDGNDFWVLEAILKFYSPRLICAEYNPSLEGSIVMEYNKDHVWNETNNYGFSWLAGIKLFNKMGYKVILNNIGNSMFAVPQLYVRDIEYREPQAIYARNFPTDDNAKFVTYI